MTDALKVAVAGTGNAGFEHLREFDALPGARVVVDRRFGHPASRSGAHRTRPRLRDPLEPGGCPR